jgi:hypothetical protein
MRQASLKLTSVLLFDFSAAFPSLPLPGTCKILSKPSTSFKINDLGESAFMQSVTHNADLVLGSTVAFLSGGGGIGGGGRAGGGGGGGLTYSQLDEAHQLYMPLPSSACPELKHATLSRSHVTQHTSHVKVTRHTSHVTHLTRVCAGSSSSMQCYHPLQLLHLPPACARTPTS